MSRIQEIERLALELCEADRALLAATLLESLSAVDCEPDDGLAEAFRRDQELEAQPETSVSLEELDRKIAQRKR
jgi:hypothetical protein